MIVYVDLQGEAKLTSVETLYFTEKTFTIGNLNVWSKERHPTHQEITLAEKFRSEAEADQNVTYTKFAVVSVQTQLVSGTNYKFRVNTGSDIDYILMVVYVPLQGDAQLTSVQPLLLAPGKATGMLGAPSPQKAPTLEDIVLAERHRPEAEARLNRIFTRFDVVSVSTQVVAGFIKSFRIIVDGQLD
jgi:hypothetical protein